MDSDKINNSSFHSVSFPRNLSPQEKEILFSILPVNKTGYNNYRDRIDKLVVIGNGRFGEHNFILGTKDDKPDLTLPSSQVFAIGGIEYLGAERYITIHEEEENKIEFDISLSIKDKNFNTEKILSSYSYSEWIPGMNDPKDGNKIREVIVKDKNLILAISPSQKKIWIYEGETGINHIIPVTNFYNEAVHVLHIQETKTALNSNLLFENNRLFTDETLRQTFLNYNKIRKKINLDYSQFSLKSESKKSNFLSKLFKRG
ncbi:MAG: hypothetical protein C4539_19900 [Ignavibacteriales bacterium]|nr:MAG: hypothetical protein C4539_19900 [Ignavibacteriales bacterium]